MKKTSGSTMDQVLYHTIKLSGGRLVSLCAVGIIHASEWHRLRRIGDAMLSEPDEAYQHNDRDFDPDG